MEICFTPWRTIVICQKHKLFQKVIIGPIQNTRNILQNICVCQNIAECILYTRNVLSCKKNTRFHINTNKIRQKKIVDEEINS